MKYLIIFSEERDETNLTHDHVVRFQNLYEDHETPRKGHEIVRESGKKTHVA